MRNIIIFTALLFAALILIPFRGSRSPKETTYTPVEIAPTSPLGDNELVWMITHWPPAMTINEEKESVTGGQYGIQLEMIQKMMPEYKHKTIHMSLARYWSDVERGVPYLYNLSLKTPKREEIAHFSLPHGLIFPNMLNMREETFIALGEPDSISLREIMRMDNLRGLFISHRSYGKELDEIIRDHSHLPHIDLTVAYDTQLVQMVLESRAHYMVEYPFIVNTLVQSSFPGRCGELISIPIAETVPYYLIYISAPKTDEGREIVEKVNSILKILIEREEFLEPISLMYTAEQEIEIRKLYKEILKPIILEKSK